MNKKPIADIRRWVFYMQKPIFMGISFNIWSCDLTIMQLLKIPISIRKKPSRKLTILALMLSAISFLSPFLISLAVSFAFFDYQATKDLSHRC